MTSRSNQPAQSIGSSPLRRESLPEVIANAVAEAIASQRLVAGERIVETSLAAQLSVSRVPVREALKVLHTQGIIAGGGHKGFRVASFSPKMVQSVQEARLEIETLLLRDALKNWQHEDPNLDELDSVVRKMKVSARANDFPGMLRADLQFHEVICTSAQNPIIATLWRAIARHVMIILNLARFRDTDLKVVVRRHQSLRDQIAQRLGKEPSIPELRGLLEAHFLAERLPQEAGPEVPLRAPKPPTTRRPLVGKNRS
jgi:DNA-binding GntR family transcriptional regulator